MRRIIIDIRLFNYMKNRESSKPAILASFGKMGLGHLSMHKPTMLYKLC